MFKKKNLIFKKKYLKMKLTIMSNFIHILKDKENHKTLRNIKSHNYNNNNNLKSNNNKIINRLIDLFNN